MSQTDPLSPLASDSFRKYADAYQKLVVPEGTPSEAHALLDGVKFDQMLAVPMVSRPHAAAMLCGLWLWHDGLNESHEIAQQTPEQIERAANMPPVGELKSVSSALSMRFSENQQEVDEETMRDAGVCLAFWHAIMHRREGDFSNSLYWYAKVGQHSIMPAIGANVGEAINPLPVDKSLMRLLRDGWNPAAFVDLVEEVNGRPGDPRLRTVVAIQRVEWQMLFDHCTRQASGK